MATEQVETGDGELFLSAISNGNASTPQPLSVTFSAPPLTPSPPDGWTLFVAGGDDDVVMVTDEAVGGVTGGCGLSIGGWGR